MNFIIYNAFKDRKKYNKFILLFVLSFFVFSIFLSYYYYYDYEINYILGNKLENRMLEVTLNDENTIDFSDIKYIENVKPLYSNKLINYNSKNYQINYMHNGKIKFGNKEINDNEIAISYHLFKILNFDYKDIGNVKLSFIANNKKYSYKIVAIINDSTAHFYVSLEEFERIFNLIPNKYCVTINKYINLPIVVNTLKSNGCNTDIYDATGLLEINKVKQMQLFYAKILIAFIIMIIIFIINIIKNIIFSENKNIAILKAIGFRNGLIKYIMLIRILTVIFIAIFLNFILQLIGTLILKNFFEYPIFNYSYLFKNNICILLFVPITIIIYFVLAGKNIKKLNVLLELKS